MNTDDSPTVSFKTLRLPAVEPISRSDPRLRPRLSMQRMPDCPLGELTDEQMLGHLNSASRRIIAQQRVAVSLGTLKEFMRLFRSKANQSSSDDEERSALQKLRSLKARAHIAWRHQTLDDISMSIIVRCVEETRSIRDFRIMEAFFEALIKRIGIEQELADWASTEGGA